MTRAIFLVLGTLLASTALARPIKVSSSSVSASSEYPETEGVSYEAKYASDGKIGNVWIEGGPGSGLGEHVEFDLGGAQSVTGFRIWNGNWYSPDFWERHNRIKEIEAIFSDGTKQTFTLKDQMVPETVMFPKAVTTTTLRLKIKSIYGGSTFPETAISEVQILDGQPEDFFRPVGAGASTTYPADADGNYDAANLWDYMLDSMWCEASPGDGANEWVEFDLGQTRKISKATIHNGNAYSIPVNLKTNQPTTATLKFDDGATETITLKTNPLAQTFTFAPHNTQKVRVTFTAVKRGVNPEDPSLNDLCMSEIRFSE